MSVYSKTIPFAVAAILASHVASVTAAESSGGTTAQDADLFTLGEVQVVGDRVTDASSDDNVSAEEVWKFNANTLTDAVKLVPGVTSNFISNGRRNEGDISVRGFDRWRVPLAIDGIRVYLPADNRIDFNRFLTPDLGEIQVRKGRVSVLDGPGAMGGMVNLVTRKPTKPFEAEVQGGSSFDRSADYDGWSGTAIVGTRFDSWYAQASATELKRDSWTLSKDFKPVGPAEDGGERNGSGTKDWRINLKAGYTPNNTDEYSLNYTRQSGEKGAPLGVDFFKPSPPAPNTTTVNTPTYQANNYWTWPDWDVESAYFLSNTQFDDSTYVKTRLSYSEFNNSLFAWDDVNYNSQSLAGRFRSYYHDNSLGASVEAGSSFTENSTTRAAAFFRQDRHREYNDNRPTNPSPALHTIEPYQHNEEQTWSLALENTWNVSKQTDLIAGVSYDRNELKRAEEYGTPTASQGLHCQSGAAPCLYDYPLGNSDSLNWQFALQRHYSENGQVGLSVSSRSRFPNNFERFSTRFGTNSPNPDLAPEQANHFELNWQASPVQGAQLSASVFYTDVQELIQTVVLTPAVGAVAAVTQSQNVGDGHFTGAEVAGDFRMSSRLHFGANYSYLHRTIKDSLQPNIEATGAPNHLGFVYVAFQPLASVTVQPSLELAGNRWVGHQRQQHHGLPAPRPLRADQPAGHLAAVEESRGHLRRNQPAGQELPARTGLPRAGRSLFTKVRVSF